MRSTVRISLVCATLLAVGLECAKADVIFTNFGPGDSFGIFSYGFGRVPVVGGMRGYTGSAFTPSGTFRLDDFTMALEFGFAPGNPLSPQPLDILLMNNSSAGLPAGIIESFDEIVDTPSPRHLVTIDSALHPILSAGAQYWIVATAGSATLPIINGGWFENSIGDMVPRAVVQGTDLNALSVVGGTRPAFRVEGTAVSAVPEPTSTLLLGTSLLFILGALACRRTRPGQ